MTTIETKTWQHIHFTCSDGEDSISVELIANHDTGKFDIQSPSEEAVSFKSLNLKQSQLRVNAVMAALKWIEMNM